MVDVRAMGVLAGIELAPRTSAPGARGAEVFRDCFERGLLVRYTGDTIALSPPLIIEPGQIDELVSILAELVGPGRVRLRVGLRGLKR